MAMASVMCRVQSISVVSACSIAVLPTLVWTQMLFPFRMKHVMYILAAY
jgi:hypothetical protein